MPAAGLLAALLLATTYFVGFHRPRSEKVNALDADASRLRAEQTALRLTITGLEKVAAQEPTFTAALQRLEKLIPAGLAQPTLLSQLQAAAREAGVELISVTFGDPSVPNGAPQSAVAGTVLVTMPLTVVMNGPYGGITDMLRRIETEKNRAVLVRAVAFTEADAGFPQLTGTWSGQAYALLPAEDPLLAGRGDGARNGTTATTPEPVKR